MSRTHPPAARMRCRASDASESPSRTSILVHLKEYPVMSFNSTASATIAFVGVLLSAASVACSADKTGTGGPDDGGGAGGGTTEGGVVSSGGKGGATSASGGQTNKGGGGASAGGGGAEKLD